MNIKVRAFINELENLKFYKDELERFKTLLRLQENDLYFHIPSSLKYEYYWEWSKKLKIWIRKAALISGGNGGYKSNDTWREKLEKEIEKTRSKIDLLKLKINDIETKYQSLDPVTQAIANAVYIKKMTFTKASIKLQEFGISYSKDGLYKRLMSGLKKLKE